MSSRASVWQQGRRFTWTAADQVLSTVSNFVISLSLVRGGGTAALGRYAVAFAVYLLVQSLQRTLLEEPLLASRRHQSEDRADDTASFVSALLLGAVSGMVVLPIALVLGNVPLVVVSIAMPALCAQDLLRYVFFRAQKAHLAALLDGVWVLASIVASPLIIRTASVEVAVAAWAAGAALGVLVGLHQLGPRWVRPVDALRWWQEKARPLGGYLTIAGVSYSLSSQGTTMALAALVGASELGRMRTAEMLLAPAALVVTSFNLFALPAYANGRRTSDRDNVLRIVAASSLLAGLAALLAVAVAPIAARLLFDGAAVAPMVLVVALVGRVVFSAASAAFFIPLKVHNRGRPIAAVYLLAAVVGMPLIVGAAALGGVAAAAWAVSGQSVVMLLGSAFVWRNEQGVRSRVGVSDVSLPPTSALIADPAERAMVGDA